MRAVILVIALAASARVTAEPESWRLTPNGLGPVKIGMTISQVAKALGGTLVGEPIEDEDSCVEKSSKAGPSDTSYMFEGGRLTRISVFDNSSVTTPRGIAVGSSEDAVRKAYSGLVSEPNAYLDPPALYLTYWFKGRKRGVRFETDDKRKVDVIHAGTSSIQYVEGCA